MYNNFKSLSIPYKNSNFAGNELSIKMDQDSNKSKI